MLLPINRLGVPICPRERRRRDISLRASFARLAAGPEGHSCKTKYLRASIGKKSILGAPSGWGEVGLVGGLNPNLLSVCLHLLWLKMRLNFGLNLTVCQLHLSVPSSNNYISDDFHFHCFTSNIKYAKK